MTIHKENWIRVLVLLILFLLPVQTAFAQFPEREDTLVVDPNEYLSSKDRNRLNEQLAQYPHEYVVVFLDQIEDEPISFAKELFTHYQLGNTSVLFVVTVEDQNKLYYAYGADLSDQGLTNGMIDSRIAALFQSYADQNKYITGMNQLISALETELDKIAEQREREKQISVKAPEQQGEETQTKVSDSALPWWVILLFVLFVALVIFVVFSIFYRKKTIRQVDRLEAYKIQLENRPFSSQLSRVKGLIMAGETEERFEKWRSKWEDILTNTLPDIEETLIDIEDYADHYRFIRSAKLLKETEARLKEIEQELDQIVQEIDELTSSEKQNREKISLLHEEYQEVKSALQRESLSLGISYPVWYEKFKKTITWFESFDTAQQNGDYLSAQDYLQAIEDVFKQIKEAFEYVPVYLVQIENEIPKQINELAQAIEEMKEKGYILEHTKVEERFAELKKKQVEVVDFMQNGLLPEMKEWIDQVKAEIEELFTLLEEEVTAKQFVLEKLEIIPALLNDLSEVFTRISETVQITKSSYSWEAEWEEQYKEISEMYHQLSDKGSQMKKLQEEAEEQYPMLKKQLQEFIEKYDQFKLKGDSFEQTINKLREEELQARETTVQLKQTLVKIRSILRKSNLPGVPEHLNTGLAMSEEAVEELRAALEQQQLDLPRVLHMLKEAKAEVESVSQAAKSVINQAHKAEQYIQYGNRYRRYDIHVDELLHEAEQAFRSCQYREALDYAEAALDKADRQWRDVFEAEEYTGT